MAILVADANAEDRAAIRKQFHALQPSLQIREASNGDEALNALQSCVFDLALVSSTLPKLKGLAFQNWAAGGPNGQLFGLLYNNLHMNWALIADRIHAYDAFIKPLKAEAADNLLKVIDRRREATPVLIVGGNERLRRIVSTMLRSSRFPFAPSEADTGRVAVETVSTEQYSIVIIDSKLSDMVGIEAVARMSRYSTMKNILLSDSWERSISSEALG